ncbi:MAG: hypothetical protein OXI91_15470 [Chloroflexota bacterium]|nr:hypothetical protein [Chloroflexota bacterium]
MAVKRGCRSPIDDSVFQGMRTSITVKSGSLGQPWPRDLAIAHIEPDFVSYTDPDGLYAGEFTIVRDESLKNVIYHEMAHHYRFGPDWVNEVGAEFLESLVHLRVDSNELAGPLQPALGSLSNLEVLDLGYNHITCEVPPALGSLPNLGYCSLT